MNNFDILAKILTIPAILIAFTFHEFAHAWMADRLGDKTPKFQGRLSLNPLVHIDIMGFIMILLFGFGFAKPVQTNPTAYKNYYKDDLKVSFAGPFANLIVAMVFIILSIPFNFIPITLDNKIVFILFYIVSATVSLNCILFILNLIPIPGFDGFHILRDLFPKAFYKVSDNLTRYGFVIFIIFILPILPNGNSLFTYIVGVPASLLEGLLRLPINIILG